MSTTITLTDAQITALAPLFALAGVSLPGSEPADQAPAKPAKAYRSATAKAKAKAQVSALWTKTLADAGVTKRAQLSDAQFAAYQVGAKAIWAAAPRTRATKA